MENEKITPRTRVGLQYPTSLKYWDCTSFAWDGEKLTVDGKEVDVSGAVKIILESKFAQ